MDPVRIVKVALFSLFGGLVAIYYVFLLVVLPPVESISADCFDSQGRLAATAFVRVHRNPEAVVFPQEHAIQEAACLAVENHTHGFSMSGDDRSSAEFQIRSWFESDFPDSEFVNATFMVFDPQVAAMFAERRSRSN